MWDNFNDLGVCHYTEEELKYAKALYDSVEMQSDKLPGDATEDSSDIYEYVDEKSKHGTTPMNEFLVPYLYYEKPRMGSTDVGAFRRRRSILPHSRHRRRDIPGRMSPVDGHPLPTRICC